jgi:hypothetical protein
MGLSILARRAQLKIAEEREDRHRNAWAEARAVEERWRAEMLPPAVVAAWLGVHRETLRRWSKSGQLVPVKMGPFPQSPVRYRRADVERFMAEIAGKAD